MHSMSILLYSIKGSLLANLANYGFHSEPNTVASFEDVFLCQGFQVFGGNSCCPDRCFREKKVENGMDALWDSGDWNNEKNGNDVIQTLLNAPSVELIEAFFQIHHKTNKVQLANQGTHRL